MIELSPLGAQLLEDLPPYLSEDPQAVQVIDCCARELQRASDAGEGFRLKLFPANADDEFHTLGMWELLLGLPVEPVGVPINQRRDKVLAHIRKRTSGDGAHWVELMTEGLGATPWVYEEGPAAYTITIGVGYDPGSYTAGQIAFLARAITPAHLDVIVGYSEGFLLGISEPGEPL